MKGNAEEHASRRIPQRWNAANGIRQATFLPEDRHCFEFGRCFGAKNGSGSAYVTKVQATLGNAAFSRKLKDKTIAK
jgi:hypothetical protein